MPAAATTTDSGHNASDVAADSVSIESVTLEVPDPVTAGAFYAAAFDLGDRQRFRASEAPTSGFRGFTLSLVVSQPATVDPLVGAALEAGATALKPVARSLWGYGGVVQAPDGTIWKVATSKKKNTGPATREIDQVVLLLGAGDVAASKRFYLERGLTVARSFAHSLRRVRRPLDAHQAGALQAPRPRQGRRCPPEGTGSHRIIIGSHAGPFTDPDGFAWKPA